MNTLNIKSVKGPRASLPHHPEYCDLVDVRSYARRRVGPLAIDLFSGAGGLSLGLEQAGFNVIMGVDHDPAAIETHAANFGGVSFEGDLSHGVSLDLIVAMLGKLKIDLVAGGPPCQPFSRAGENKIKSLVRKRVRPEHDVRRDLWQGFLYVVEKVRPRAVLVENVPDMANGRNASVYKNIVLRLEELGYDTHSRILAASQFGVPQYRERLFTIGFREHMPFAWPEPSESTVTIRDAIGDLPPVTGGALENPTPYCCGEPTRFQRQCRASIEPSDQSRVYDHVTREVRADDLEAFKVLKSGDPYNSLPSHLQRYRSDIFDDKYNRLRWDAPSRTITAHIAKDGYWYIHPEQHRTLTVREAARLQTFPDRFRFAGYRTNGFKQIGEAVPPILAREVGASIRQALRSRRRVKQIPGSAEISSRLGKWMDEEKTENLRMPWRATSDPWLISLGAVFASFSGRMSNWNWHTLKKRWPSASEFLDDAARETTFTDGHKFQMFELVAVKLSGRNRVIAEDLKPLAGIRKNLPSLVASFCGRAPEPYGAAAPLRVAHRIYGQVLDSKNVANRNSRLSLVRATAADRDGRIYAALTEIGERLCKPASFNCEQCPLSEICLTADNC